MNRIRVTSGTMGEIDEVLRNARRGSYLDLIDLSNAWDPALISPDQALSVFLLHLEESRVPRSVASRSSPRENLAVGSMNGLSNVIQTLGGGEPHFQHVIDAWPGIFAWSVHLVSRLEQLDRNEQSKELLRVLSMCWYYLSDHDAIRDIIIRTPGSVELSMRMWRKETVGQAVSPPFATGMLVKLFKGADTGTMERAVGALDGTKKVVKLALTCLQTASTGPQNRPLDLVCYMDLLDVLSRPDHPLRNELRGANAVQAVTTVLVKVSNEINISQDPNYVHAVESGFRYLRNHLDTTNGFIWVSQAVDAGILRAFCDCSPHFSRLQPQQLQGVLDVVRKVLSSFLIFRSVVEPVGVALEKIDCGPQKARVNASIAKAVWDDFQTLAKSRYKIVKFLRVLVNPLICDNCQKVGNKEGVRKCAGCLTTFYCSKECQVAAWKGDDHKTTCQLKKRLRTEGRNAPISKRDNAFFCQLSLYDARAHLPQLRMLARSEFADDPLSNLIICVDYSDRSARCTLKRADEYVCGLLAESEAIATSHDAIIEKFRSHPGHYTLIETTLRGGNGSLTLTVGWFWSADSPVRGDSEDRVGGLQYRQLPGSEDDRETLRWTYERIHETMNNSELADLAGETEID
ncbi:hypothetical protein A0H81_10589 [Grifola frondosa]|uniref:MYND-type domain-containing protein n=1 Tax=Grifola frondosa TaxID=5627 RepID=A0A1C7LYZ8_GRIFR|nr:hypothetical protein A0H81_10589 [Grifola frondosa]